jgi:hypothetical protein
LPPRPPLNWGSPTRCACRRPMTEMGQTRPWGDVRSMSGSPPKAAVWRTSVDVSKVPIGDIADYSIISSAAAEKAIGTSMPKASELGLEGIVSTRQCALSCTRPSGRKFRFDRRTPIPPKRFLCGPSRFLPARDEGPRCPVAIRLKPAGHSFAG